MGSLWFRNMVCQKHMVSNMSGNPSVPYFFFCQDTACTWPDLIFPKFKHAQIQFQTAQVAFRKRICTNAGCTTHKASRQTALNPKNYPIRFVTAQRKNCYAHGFSAFDSAQSGAHSKHGVKADSQSLRTDFQAKKKKAA